MASLASVRSNGANREDDTLTVTSRQHGRRAIFVSGDVRFQDGDVVDLKEMGIPGSFVVFLFPPGSELALAYLSLRYTHRSTVL